MKFSNFNRNEFGSSKQMKKILQLFSDTQTFINALHKRAKIRNSARRESLLQYEEMDQTLTNLFRRLNSEGFNDLIELLLVAMKSFLLKLKCKVQQDVDESLTTSTSNGRIVVSRKAVQYHEYPLEDKHTIKLPLEPRKSRNAHAIATDQIANQEWQHIYAGNREQLL